MNHENVPSFFQVSIMRIIAAEGGYSNNPADAGGETMYGITVATARNWGYVGAMRDLPRHLAEKIYYDRYIIAPGFNQVFEINSRISYELIDTGVNMGPIVATRFLQRSLNAFNFKGRYGVDLISDGKAGPKTWATLKAFLAHRGTVEGVPVLLTAMNALQGARYIELTEAKASQREFAYGWIAGRVEL